MCLHVSIFTLLGNKSEKCKKYLLMCLRNTVTNSFHGNMNNIFNEKQLFSKTKTKRSGTVLHFCEFL